MLKFYPIALGVKSALRIAYSITYFKQVAGHPLTPGSGLMLQNDKKEEKNKEDDDDNDR